MVEGGQPGKRRARLFLLIAGGFLLLIVLGVWQGDFHETLLNGKTL